MDSNRILSYLQMAKNEHAEATPSVQMNVILALSKEP
nr:MAG TPA: hypothetical protein [Caudoviricetes sp.]